MKKIILSTINARYSHSSLALRYLYANLKELKDESTIQEFVINEKMEDAAERILADSPKIVALGVYIWNASDVSKLVKIIRKVSPETIVVLGGPEVSHFPLRMDFESADYVIQGEGEIEFYKLCKNILANDPPKNKFIQAGYVDPAELEFPYKYYTDHDIQNRVIYVEASRGCPFTCQFCLSSIDKNMRYFDLAKLLNEFEILWKRGARKFKFIDRTFNLNIKITTQILDYFLQKEPPFFVHFEVVPEHFPESLKERISRFPEASMQLEVGIQTLNKETADNINRKLNFEKIKENLYFLENETNAHLHVDLIVGLPGESIESFGENLNLLSSITSSEIQIGILKKLSGTTICEHDTDYGMVYSDLPPYEILKTDLVSFEQMQKMKRFARFWDLTYNSGNFNKTVRLIWNDGDVFQSFYRFSEWIYDETESTWQISLNRMAELLFKFLSEVLNQNKEETANTIAEDLLKIRGRKLPKVIKENISDLEIAESRDLANINRRQIKHL